MLRMALAFAARNINREDNEKEITEFLNLVDFNFRDENGDPTKYCAAGVSFCASAAFADYTPAFPLDRAKVVSSFKKLLPLVDKYHFYPSASVLTIHDNAIERRIWVPRSSVVKPKRGWLVIFTWSKKEIPNHIGIVTSSRGEDLYTVEFNTTKKKSGNPRDGGCVATRRRPLDKSVLGYVKLYS